MAGFRSVDKWPKLQTRPQGLPSGLAGILYLPVQTQLWVCAKSPPKAAAFSQQEKGSLNPAPKPLYHSPRPSLPCPHPTPTPAALTTIPLQLNTVVGSFPSGLTPSSSVLRNPPLHQQSGLPSVRGSVKPSKLLRPSFMLAVTS